MKEYEQLCNVVACLRDPEHGCPWDLRLTHDSLKPTCIEEAAEVISGINILNETGNPDGLQEELGDLLLQVIMHAQIAEEEGLFTMEDVCRGVKEKMIRRHPHVFGSQAPEGRDGSEQQSWDEIKRQEKAGKEWMDAYLPDAMLEARDLVDRARKRKGFR